MKSPFACAVVLLAALGAEDVAVQAPPQAPSKHERAEGLLREGHATEAATLYAEILSASPEDPVAIAGRIRSLIVVDDWKRALDEARRYDGSSSHPDVRTSFGEALFRAGHLDECSSVLTPVARGEGAPPRALVTLALLRAAEGKDDEASLLLDRALLAAPSDRYSLYVSAGSAASRAKMVELLERYLDVSRGDDPDRIEGARGTLELYRALGERPIWVPAARPERLELPLRALADRPGHLDGFVVDAEIGEGKKVTLLLDSGSTGFFLLDRVAKRGGFAPLSKETVFGGGGKGRTSSRRGLLPSFAVGGLRFRDALVTTGEQEIDPTGRYQGVLGLWVFDGYVITLDLSRGRLVLEPASETPAGVPYWRVGGQMLVEAASSEGQKGLFLFDTGATRTLVSRTFAESCPHAILGSTANVRGYGGSMDGAVVVKGVRVNFLDLEQRFLSLRAVDLTLRSRLGGVEISGFLGLDLLNDTRIVVNTKTRRLSVSKTGRR
jgi:hypothetical protein